MANRLSKSVFSKALAILLCFSICFTFIPFIDSEGAVANASAASTIELGDYVQMGTYDGEPIIWRCVAFYKVDTDGNVDLNSTKKEYEDGYLPLMLSDKILCLKAFDASGENLQGSHKIFRTDSNQENHYDRVESGSNYWGDSNIRCWLNSEADAGNVDWTCGNPPDKKHVSNGYNAYDQEAGFLSNFNESERYCMKVVTQYQLLHKLEYPDMSPYGETTHIYNLDFNHAKYINQCVTNFDKAYKEETTDTMFLLDIKQINMVYQNRKTLGSTYYIGSMTENCIAKNANVPSSKKNSTKWNGCWIRSPEAGDRYYDFYSETLRYVRADGIVWECNAYYDCGGIRPAFFMDISKASFISGDGEEGTPYKFGDTPAINNNSDTSINIEKVTYPGGQTAEYAISTSKTVQEVPESVWQESSEFTGLEPNTRYYVFVRAKGVSGGEVKISEVTTKKAATAELTINIDCESGQTDGPVPDTVEYQVNSEKEWISGTGETISISPGTTYKFRVKATEDTAAGKEITVTAPSKAAAPDAPTIYSRTEDSVTLTPLNGYEYRCGEDGIWQDSNEFKDLSRSESHTFYQRVKATETSFCSETSEALTVDSFDDVILSAVGVTALTAGIVAIAASRMSSVNKLLLSENGIFSKKILSWVKTIAKIGK